MQRDARVHPHFGGRAAIIAAPPDRGSFSKRPQLLPDGRHLLVTVLSQGYDSLAVAVLNLATQRETVVRERAGFATYAPTGPAPTQGHLIYGRNGTLFAAPFDLARLETGSSYPVLDGALTLLSTVTSAAVSRSGTLAYLAGDHADIVGGSELIWANLDGTTEAPPWRPQVYAGVALAPDGHHAAVNIVDPKTMTADLWVYETTSGQCTRLTSGGTCVKPVWTPDGQRLIYSFRPGSVVSLLAGSVALVPQNLARRAGRDSGPRRQASRRTIMTGVAVLGWALVHFMWQGALLAAAAALGLQLLRSSTASARYVLGCGTLAMMLAMPIATMVLLDRTPVAPEPVAASPRFSSATGTPVPATLMPARAPETGGGRPGQSPDSALTVLVALWTGGVTLMGMRLAGAWYRVRRMHQLTKAVAPSPWASVSARLAPLLGVHRTVDVIESDTVTTAILVGWVRPVIVLPAACLAALSPQHVEAILAHELAHVRRHDVLVNALQSIAETLLFYHPAVWWLSARIREEREYCCDDVAVRRCGDPGEYVEALARLEAWRTDARLFAVAATGGGSLLARARRLLEPSPPCRGSGWHGAVVLPVLAMIVSAALVRAIETDSVPAAAPPSLVPVSADDMSVTAADPMPTIASTRTAVDSSSGPPASERRVTDVPAGRPHEPPPLPAAVVAHVESSAGTARPSSRELQQPDAGRVPGRRLVFAFDPTSLGPDEFDASRRAALRFVDGQMADGDLIAIVWVAASVDTVVDFTSDRETLRATLQSLAPPAPAAPGTDAPLLGLSTVCDAVAAIPGRKSVLFLTSGARLEPLDLTELRQTTRACSRANVALYPLDARGLRDMPDPVGTTDVFR